MNEIKQFERKSKPPTKAELKSMKEQVMNQSKPKEDKKMPKKSESGDKKPRKRLTPEQVAKMIKEWDSKSTQGWADEFDVSYQTIVKMAEVVRKEDPKLCPKKTAVKVKRADIAKEAIALLKK